MYKIDPSEILPYISRRNDLHIESHDIVISTNNIAKEYGASGVPEGVVVIANKQTGGRGSANRSFFSPSETGIYMSILLRPQIGLTPSLLITAAAAVAVCEAIQNVCNKIALIKWVNDIYIDSGKVCGILTESSIIGSKPDYSVLGIGINVYAPKNGFPHDIADKAAAIYSHCETDIRPQLIAEILNKFFLFYNDISSKTFLPFYRQHSMLIGKQVDVLKEGTREPALALRIDDDCHLVVKYADGQEETLFSNSIIPRL